MPIPAHAGGGRTPPETSTLRRPLLRRPVAGARPGEEAGRLAGVSGSDSTLNERADIVEEAPTSVNCSGNAHITPGVEDVTSMCINFGEDRFASIQSSWLDPRKIREMTIVGSKRMIVYDDVEPLEKIKIYDARVEVPPHYDTFAETFKAYGTSKENFVKAFEIAKKMNPELTAERHLSLRN